MFQTNQLHLYVLSCTNLYTDNGLYDFSEILYVSILGSYKLKLTKGQLEPTQPPIQWVLGAKKPRHEADHSPLSTAEVKNVWSYTYTPPLRLLAWCLIKQ